MLAVFLLSSIYAPASASKVVVTISRQQVHAAFSLSLTQNVTALPNIATSVDSSSGTNISSVFAQSIREADPSASASNLAIGLNSTERGLNLTCNFDVSNVSQRNGDILSVNMTWLPFDVNADLRSQDFSFNTIGSRYLKSVVTYYANASRFVGLPNATITGVIFFVNGTSVNAPAAEDYVGNFTTLKFDQLTPDLDQWNRTYTLINNTTTWRYFPSQLFSFDMRIERKNVTTDYVANYGYSAIIATPGVGRSQGTIILIDVGTGETEWAMEAVVILAIISAITVQLLFRSKRKKLAKFQRK